jgi:hypothetical protein
VSKLTECRGIRVPTAAMLPARVGPTLPTPARSCAIPAVRNRACIHACRMAPVSTHEFVSVSEAATRLGVSPTTVRERIRAGLLEAERVQRPQGSVFLVKLVVDERTTPDDEQIRTGDAQDTPDHARASAELISAAVAPLVGRLAVADSQIAAQAETIRVQSETIAGLREERGTLAERAEHERGRAARAEAELTAEREARKALEARTAPQMGDAPREPAVGRWRTWVPWLLAALLLFVLPPLEGAL